MVAMGVSLLQMTYLLRLLTHKLITLLKTFYICRHLFKFFYVVYVYRTQGSCSSAFLHDFFFVFPDFCHLSLHFLLSVVTLMLILETNSSDHRRHFKSCLKGQ